MEQDRPVSVAEAASILGITKDAVRKRISRGTLRADKHDDGWTVFLDGDQDTRHDTGQTADDGHYWELINDLKADKEELRGEIDRLRRELERKDQMMAALIERIPPQIAAPVDDHVEKPPEQSRPWWRFWE